MSDHDPGNAGGSIVIPPSPIKPTRNLYKCETCGARFRSQHQLEQHASGHVVPHPVLIMDDRVVGSPFVIADSGHLHTLATRDAVRIEMDGHSRSPEDLPRVLLAANGRPEFELVLVSPHEHVRNVYRLQVAIFDEQRLSEIEVAFLSQLNGTNRAIPDIPSFLRPWERIPERAYASALAEFRLAMIMRADVGAHDSDGRSGYRYRLTDSQRMLRSLSRRLARTVVAVCGLIENDFSIVRKALSDEYVENGLAWFRHVVHGKRLSWARNGDHSIRLVVDPHTEMLLEAVDCVRRGDDMRADKLLIKLANACADGRDVFCAKKVAAALWWRESSARAPAILQGDPVFAAMLQRRR